MVLVEGKACGHAANASLSRLELIWMLLRSTVTVDSKCDDSPGKWHGNLPDRWVEFLHQNQKKETTCHCKSNPSLS